MFGALAYNQNKVDSEEAKVLFSNRMLLSEDGHFSIGECMRSFDNSKNLFSWLKKSAFISSVKALVLFVDLFVVEKHITQRL